LLPNRAVTNPCGAGKIASWLASGLNGTLPATEFTDLSYRLPKLVATSVVRGSQQGESHGGVYTIDFDKQEVLQHLDWNTGDIEWAGRGADRGLRGIEFDDDDIYIAASDELFCFDRNFEIKASYRNRFLKHCHEIWRMERTIFLTSTGFDSLLAFDLDAKEFIWGLYVQRELDGWSGRRFNPGSEEGPGPSNAIHINMVYIDRTGIYLSGLHARALLHINSRFEVSEVCDLPAGAHNARPFDQGILFNDTSSDCVRYAARDGGGRAFKIRTYDESEITFAGVDDSRIARQGFGRGLCAVDDRFIAGGSSPSTITLYDLKSNQVVAAVNLTMDIRNAIHGLEVWPYEN
jgi:hypothetical protein